MFYIDATAVFSLAGASKRGQVLMGLTWSLGEIEKKGMIQRTREIRSARQKEFIREKGKKNKNEENQNFRTRPDMNSDNWIQE